MGIFSSGTDNSPILKWEALKGEEGMWRKGDSGIISHTYRTKVPGGWLILASNAAGSGLTFMPDPQHEWDGNSL